MWLGSKNLLSQYSGHVKICLLTKLQYVWNDSYTLTVLITAVSQEQNCYHNVCKTSKKNMEDEYSTTDGNFTTWYFVANISWKKLHYSFDMAQQVCSLWLQIYIHLPM